MTGILSKRKDAGGFRESPVNAGVFFIYAYPETRASCLVPYPLLASIFSLPPIYGLRTVGIVMLPSAFW